MKFFSATTLLSACVAGVLGLGLPALAQTNGGAPQNGASQEAPPAAAPSSESQTTAPVLWVSSVEVLRSAHGPELDVVRVRGLSSNEGWESAELVPLTKGSPPDGMLDLALVAQAPSNSTAPATFPEVDAVFVIEPGHPYKGVRVHGATNRVTLKSLPGYAAAPPPPNDCSNCMGKHFVGRGEAAPAGVKSSEVIHEEELPKTVRVIKADDGIRKLDTDPNRLTLVLDEEGRIVMALWD